MDLSLDVKTVRYDTLKVAKRLEAELGDEPASCIAGDPREWDLFPPPEGFFTVGIDGGYVRHWCDKTHTCEVIVGKSMRNFAEAAADRMPSLKERMEMLGHRPLRPRIVKIFELAFPPEVTPLPLPTLRLVFRSTLIHTQRQYGR